MAQLYARNTSDISGRPAIELGNGLIKVVIANPGGMVSELSNGGINAHWVPQFRGNFNEPYDQELHSGYWKCKLLYNVAGNFPCIPNFGGDCEAYGVKLPPHGAAANNKWVVDKTGKTDNAAYLISSMLDSNLPQLSYRKYDILLEGHPVHYSVLKIKNNGKENISINVGWHNTVGAPFLQAGCLIDLCAKEYTTPPAEFEKTQLVAINKEFESLEQVPTIDGSIANMRIVPLPNGHTDFIIGAVPKNAQLGWGSVLNPNGLLYLSFFKGPAAVKQNEIALQFNDLWLQYGGRHYTPWANQEGGTDLTFCLGQENVVGGFGGLEWSLKNPEVLGNQTTVELKAGEEKTLYYGTIFDKAIILEKGVSRVEKNENGIIVYDKRVIKSSIPITADSEFKIIEGLVKSINLK